MLAHFFGLLWYSSLRRVEHLLLVALLHIRISLLRLLKLLTIDHALRMLRSWLDRCRLVSSSSRVYTFALLHILHLVLVLDGHATGAAIGNRHVLTSRTLDAETGANVATLIGELKAWVDAASGTAEEVEEGALTASQHNNEDTPVMLGLLVS